MTTETAAETAANYLEPWADDPNGWRPPGVYEWSDLAQWIMVDVRTAWTWLHTPTDQLAKQFADFAREEPDYDTVADKDNTILFLTNCLIVMKAGVERYKAIRALGDPAGDGHDHRGASPSAAHAAPTSAADSHGGLTPNSLLANNETCKHGSPPLTCVRAQA